MPTEKQTRNFWNKVKKTETCWLWKASTIKGYGQLSLGRNNRTYAHRVAYEMLIGPITEGLVIDHLCRQPLCVNPAHMEVVTQGENCRRGEGWKFNASKTHCKKGHEYTEANTYVNPRGSRECRICMKLRVQKFALKAA